MKKSNKKPKEIKMETLYEILDNEIDSYDIRENGAMEKKMTLIKFKKELDRILNTITENS